MRIINVEFTHFHKGFGQEVVVEAEAVFYKGVQNADSDWDAQDYLDITTVDVFHEGEAISIDIPQQVIYAEISSQIRNAEMSVAFMEESGGF